MKANPDRLLALRAQPPNVDAHEAEAVALALYDLTARAQPLEGERDRNFRLETCDGRRFVLKFIDHDADDIIVAGQTAVLVHLAERNPALPVPRVVLTRGGNLAGVAQTAPGGGGTSVSCRVRMVTYLPGNHVSYTCPSPTLLRSVGSQIAQLDRALRDFSHPSLDQPIAWDIRRAPSLLPALQRVESPSARRLVSAALEPLPELLARLRGLRAQAIHGDCHPRNLLADETACSCVGIIDLGDMIRGPLALEIAVTMAEFLTDGVTALDGLAELLAGYASAQTLEPAEVATLYDLITARIAVGVLIQAWRTQHAPIAGSARGDLEEMSANALEELASRGRNMLTGQWQKAAGAAVLLRRRHFALGASAELSYDRPVHVVRGDGVWIYTGAGERLLDVYNNVPHVGHAHPAVASAVARQASLISSNTRYIDERIIEYVERLTATFPQDLNTCLFVNSGSEANDIAWRIAKSHTGQGGALVMTHAYHGITDAISALSPAICPKPPPHVEQLALPTEETDIERALARLAERGFKPAALLMDSALTSSGIYDPPRNWVAPIAAAARQAGGLIIADEVQVGLGRSGSDFWGFNRRGMEPDIVTLGKPVGNGYPLGVVVTRREILERFQRDAGFFSTFGGNPVAAAAGIAVLDVLQQEHLMENARVTGDYFMAQLRALAAKYPTLADVRGCGLLLGVEVAARHPLKRTRQLVNGLRDRGVLIGAEGPRGNVLKLRPPMPFRREHVDVVIAALAAVLLDCP